MKIFVIDTNKQPLQPCHPARARQLLQKGKAAVYRRYPFTIILKREIVDADNQPRGATRWVIIAALRSHCGQTAEWSAQVKPLRFHRVPPLSVRLSATLPKATPVCRSATPSAKTHWLDAACVGVSTPEVLKVEGIIPLIVTATGHGSRQM